MSGVQEALERRFYGDRVVFWHDPTSEYAGVVDDLALGAVTTIRVSHNEYAIKHRLLHVEPEGKFLVYRCGPAPTGISNWLLDLELAYGVFTADRASMVAQELELSGDAVGDVVVSHEAFFNSAKRVRALKALLKPGDDATLLRAKMSAVLLGQPDHSLSEITRTLWSENALNKSAKFDALVEFGLDDFYWQGVQEIYGYTSSTPTVDDFVLWTFQRAIEGFRGDGYPTSLRNLELDFASLRNDRRSQAALVTLARRASSDLGYAATIEDADFRDLLELDIFEQTDQKIISDLAHAVAAQTITPWEVAETIRVRQNSAWIDAYRQLYAAIGAASELLSMLDSATFGVASFEEGLDRYRREWFRFDQLYRQFTHAHRTLEGGHPLEALREQVEKRYTNKFLFELGNSWQRHVDELDRWQSSMVTSQQSFFGKYVGGLLREGKKAVVIVSDALRYEVADELGSRIRQQDRFEARLEPMLGVLPSFTQLGMAALLPHRELRPTEDGQWILADGQQTNGTTARAKVLSSVDGTAIQAEDFRAMGADERRELFKDHKVIFVFHDVIDAAGDKAGTERSVFEAAEKAMAELVDLVKKAANANASNIFVTADHGFLFQDQSLPEQFFLSEKPQGDQILVENRRYVLGHGLKDSEAFTTFGAAQLGLGGDIEVQIPKSIQRLRRPGGGSRFVHGGATLQEVVVPVLVINKKRTSDTRQVNVEIMPETDKITTGQLVVKLFQTEPVSDKVQPHTLRVGLYVDGTLISNDPPPEVTFDTTSDDKRDRFRNVQLLLSQAAEAFNNRGVELRLEEQVPKTNHWRLYKRATYTLRRSFVSDFDF